MEDPVDVDSRHVDVFRGDVAVLDDLFHLGDYDFGCGGYVGVEVSSRLREV